MKNNNARYFKRVVFIFFIFMLIGFLFLFGKNGYLKAKRVNIIIKDLEDKICQLEENNTKLKKGIYNLKYNDKYIEKIARDEFKMLKPGEKIYKIKKGN